MSFLMRSCADTAARVLIVASLGASLGVAPATASEQDARLTNASVQKRPLNGNLDRTVRAIIASQTDPAWIGYSVPMIAGEHQMCCGYSEQCCISCSLEDRPSTPKRLASLGAGDQSTIRTGDRAVRLEGGTNLIVLMRVEARQQQRLRVFSDDCAIDAGGRTVYWLDGVTDTDSVAFLSGVVAAPPGTTASTDNTRREEAAISAIALHRTDAADTALERFVAAGQPDSRRKKAAFWLGNARGRRGFELLRRLVRDDRSEPFRKGAVFALSQSREPEVVDTLISLGRNDASTAVRGEALFWVAHKDEAKVGPALLQAIEKDPASEVRKKAVFALSQMKDDRGVPHLMQAARQSPSSDVRGEAIFWLAQKAGKKAAATIAEAIDNDPETEVKKKAVFALTQLPKDEGVPLLIQVARANRNPTVRKQAIFWLGQSKDPRALEFFAEILR